MRQVIALGDNILSSLCETSYDDLCQVNDTCRVTVILQVPVVIRETRLLYNISFISRIMYIYGQQ